MSKKSNSVIISVTVTLTVFVAIAAFFLRPTGVMDKYSSAVFEEAKNRQTVEIVSVPETLDTDLTVRSDEDKMAEAVSEKLINDDDFISSVGAKSEDYVSSRLDTFESDIKSKIEENASKNEIDYDAFAQALLNDEAFVSSLTETMRERLPGETDVDALTRSIIETDTFKEALKSYLRSVADGTLPLPEFIGVSETLPSDEYKVEHDEAREREIDKVLEYLGY